MRPRQNGLRTPSGRLSRANAIKPVEPTVAFRARQAVAAGLASPEWGTVAGQLFLAGRLSASQYEAAKAYGRLVGAYRQAIEAPHPKSGWTLASCIPAPSGGHPVEVSVYDLSALSAELSHIRDTIPGVVALDRLVVDDHHDSPTLPDAIAALSRLVDRWGVKVTD